MRFSRKLKERYDAKEKLIGPDAMRYHERMIMLSVLDQLWKDHLLNMDHLKEGIGLRGYGQKDPLVEYKRESFDMFEDMMRRFQEDTSPLSVPDADHHARMSRACGGGPTDRDQGGHGGGPGNSTVATTETAIVRHAALRHQWTILKKPSSAASAASLNRPVWLAPATASPCSKSCAAAKKSAATTLVPAARARNTRSAAARKRKSCVVS